MTMRIHGFAKTYALRVAKICFTHQYPDPLDLLKYNYKHISIPYGIMASPNLTAEINGLRSHLVVHFYLFCINIIVIILILLKSNFSLFLPHPIYNLVGYYKTVSYRQWMGIWTPRVH